MDGIGKSIAEKQVKLTPQEKKLRELFVVEFFKDRNSTLALCRCGFLLEYAQEYAKQFETDAYVLSLIDAVDHPNWNNQTDPVVKQINQSVEENDKTLVISTYRDIIRKGGDKERIAAAKALSALRGFDKPDKIDETDDNLIAALTTFGKSRQGDEY